jgi:CRISPR-associated protein Cmr2
MNDRAFLAFSLGPVQSFIGAARTVRDLWTGSYLLSWLTFHAMKTVLDESGPSALVFPEMEKNPLWLWSNKQLLLPQRRDELLTPCLPNRFLAHLPAGEAAELASRCVEACRTEWTDLSEKVRATLAGRYPDPTLADGNDSLWSRQVNSFFEVVTAVLPEKDCPADVLKSLLGGGAESADEGHLWGARWQLVMKLLQARRSVRHFPDYRLSEAEQRADVAQKCTLLGTFEHLGPGNRGAANSFWAAAAKKWNSRGTKTGPRERLCAVSLVKRFAWPCYFAERFGIELKTVRFSDTASMAASRWLRAAPVLEPDEVRDDHRDWSGQWLHWSSPNQDEDERPVPKDVWGTIQTKRQKQGRPPAYLAVLTMDGDRIGDLLGKVTEPKVHTEISKTLARFALELARGIVEGHDGELIYSGGDDVLALLPTETALACAAALNKAFRDNWTVPDQPRATVSAGLAVVHYKEDLRFALEQAHKAEQAAKAGGRDALQLTVCRRSGEHSTAFCPWTFVPRVTEWVKAFINKASDRWAYRLRAELDTLAGLDPSAVAAEVRRQVGRAEEQTQKGFAREGIDGPEAVAADLRQYVGLKQGEPFAAALGDFVTLCQSASFLARGRDA